MAQLKFKYSFGAQLKRQRTAIFRARIRLLFLMLLRLLMFVLEAMCRELRGNLILYRRCFFQLHKARSNAIGLGAKLPTHSPHSIRPRGPFLTETANGLVNARPSADASIPPDWIFGTHDSSLNLLALWAPARAHGLPGLGPGSSLQPVSCCNSICSAK